MSARCVSEDTLLVVRSWNSLSGLALDITGRLLDASGLIRPFTLLNFPNSNRSQAETTYQLIAGTLLDVSVTPRTGTPRRGQCYVTVGLALAVQPTTTYFELLAKGYVTAGGGLLWPGGPYLDSVEGPGMLRSITGTDPAAGAEISESVPFGARWKLRSIKALLVTSATAATRAAILGFSDGVFDLLYLEPIETQSASLTKAYNGAVIGTVYAVPGDNRHWLLPAEWVLLQGWKIQTFTSNIQAGDDWGAPQMLVEEWIEP